MNIGIVYYLAGLSQGFGIATALLGIISIIIAVIGTITLLNDGHAVYDEKNDNASIGKAKKFLRRMWLAGFAFTFVSIIVPDRKDILAMYILPKIESNERIQMLSDKALDRIERILECDLKGGDKKE